MCNIATAVCPLRGAVVKRQRGQMSKVNIPRHSRGLFINGHSPTLLATRESALVRLPLAKGLLLAASKLGFIS